MAKHWLRGVLLGASLALMLASGIALAQTLTVEADKDCVECFPVPEEPDHVAPPDEYIIYITVDGWDPGYDLCSRMYLDGEPTGERNCGPPPGVEPPLTAPIFAVPCELPDVPDGDIILSDLAGEVAAAGIEELYGEFKFRVWQPGTDNADSATWRFAEDCEAVEFVPEPGTLALLGSGLAGLAGYVTLRWRSRQ